VCNIVLVARIRAADLFCGKSDLLEIESLSAFDASRDASEPPSEAQYQ
jgi:hypothetical protein